MHGRILLPLALGAALLSACTDDAGPMEPGAAAIAPGTGPRFSGSVAPEPQARLYANGNHWLGWAPRRAFTTAERAGTDSIIAYHRIGDGNWQQYNAFYDGVVDDSVMAWAQDSRLNLNPNFVAALLVIESGFDPATFEPGGFTYGYAQMGPSSDGGLIQHIVHHTAFQWMKPQVHPDYAQTNGYSRSPSSPQTAADLANWYFSDPLKTTRAMVYHLKQLENLWKGTHKVSWDSSRSWYRDAASKAYGRSNAVSYAELATSVYGRPPTESEMFDLVAASFNRGYPWVDTMLVDFGAAWADSLKAAALTGPCLKPDSLGPRTPTDLRREAACYLDRARHYTILFQNGATSVSTGHEVVDDFNSGALDRWFTYQGPGSTLTRTVPPTSEAGQGTAVDEGQGLRVDYSVASGSWGGVGRWYSSGQNWKTRPSIGNTEGIGFWYYGNGRDLNAGAGVVVSVELQDNRSADPALQGVDTAER